MTKLDFFDHWCAGARGYVLIALLALCAALPGVFALPPLDRDESRFAQATTQMLETGDYVQIRFQDVARNKKPAGIYWLQAASVEVFSSKEGPGNLGLSAAEHARRGDRRSGVFLGRNGFP